jgi:uncharacterized protein
MGRPVVYFEIGGRDREEGAAFSASLFEWDTSDTGSSTAFMTNAGRGIDGHLAALGHEPHACTMFYVAVDDLATTMSRAAELGGATLLGPIDVPDGTFAWLRDAQGNTIDVIEPAQP